MTSRFAIGDFSRATLLSVKTLRHYHAVGLLEPSEVDADNGYRYYSENQIPLSGDGGSLGDGHVGSIPWWPRL